MQQNILPPSRVAILDDDEHLVAILQLTLERNGVATHPCKTPDELRAVLGSADVDAVLLDHRLGDTDGLELIAPLSTLYPDLPIVLMTAHSSGTLALEALRQGAFDFMTKPIDEARLLATVVKATQHRQLLGQIVAAPPSQTTTLIGNSPAMRQVFHVIQSVAPTDATVLVRGQSGTGKELIARAVHEQSDRRESPFVPLNMAALPRELVESTLFGHERGAFTGASERRIGAAEEAGTGTLFLDEICEMPLELQAKLLRFLQEGTFRRVGGSKDITSRARIISATNQDLEQSVQDGTFREDLFYRLNVVPIEVPPLRSRKGDVALIAARALSRLSEKHGKEFNGFDAAAMGLMESYLWPGNVRELIHVIERIVILHTGPVVSPAMLPREILEAPCTDAMITEGLPGGAPPESVPILPLDVVERQAIERALLRHDGSVPDAAQALGVSAATIYRKLKVYGLEASHFRDGSEPSTSDC